MPFLVAAMVLIGLLAGLNLLFTYGVIRRLREHTRRLDGLPAGGHAEPDLILGPGARPGAVPGVLLVGFFSPTCPPCREQAPRFVARAAAVGRERVLAVAVGTPDETRDLVAQFEPVAQVVVETEDGPLHQAFGVHGYPAVCVLDGDGRIVASGSTVDPLPAHAPA